MTQDAPSQVSESAVAHPAPSTPTPKPKLTICPYCGSRCRGLAACEHCRGKFDPLSRQATQNAMGPWFIRDEANPYRPGCSYRTLVRMVARGAITGDTVIRGPGSRQFWTLARWCPGVGHLLGMCHSCQRSVDPNAAACEACGASFGVGADRQQLGLGDVRPIPGRGAAEDVAPATAGASHGVPAEEERPAATAVTESAFDARAARMERELRTARRWRTVWAVACGVLVMGVIGVVLATVLDIDAGPLGRVLRDRPAASPAATQTEAATPIVTPQLEAPDSVRTDAGVSEPVSGVGATPEAGPGAEAPSGMGSEPTDNGPTGGKGPVGDQSRDNPGAASPDQEARLALLARLRQLR